MNFQWYWFTRSIGAVTVLYELVLDKGGAERGVIIAAALSFIGVEWVAKKDQRKGDDAQA
jgi:hypothetical protein